MILPLLILTFCSFIFGQKFQKVDYARRIREATPKTLPQSPANKRETADAQDENLKGKIKTLTEERIGLTGVEKPVEKKCLSLPALMKKVIICDKFILNTEGDRLT